MESDLRCNRLTCRQSLVDKAVVTTCSHIFCIDCANELFTAAQICPACETSLSEPDDCVIASLHPTNDYKTSVLSGLAPSIILEICSRAIAFWSYQIHQEQAFQQAVLKNATEKSTQMQKQLDNVIREANTELSLLNTKVANVERELEMERRKVRELQESSREKDKEYAKLKNQYDKIKRKALMNPSAIGGGGPTESVPVNPAPAYAQHQPAHNMGFMNAAVHATPARDHQAHAHARANNPWVNPNAVKNSAQRQPFGPGAGRGFGTTLPDASVSTEEVEALLGVPASRNQAGPSRAFSFRAALGGFAAPPSVGAQKMLATPSRRASTGRGFKPAGFGGS